jgi:GTP-binding protein Era
MHKTNWITFIGLTNVGKSTLVNALVGQKVSIVTPKVQTTQSVLKGIRTIGDTQLVFIDTPGLFAARAKTDQEMMDLSWNSLQYADTICMVVEARRALEHESLEAVRTLGSKGLECTLIINKVDKMHRQELLPLTQELNSLCKFNRTFMISALFNDGTDTLLSYFLETAQERQWTFEPDQLTNAPTAFMATEIVREKIFFNTHNELPYNVSIKVEKWETNPKLTTVHMKIFVKTEGQKKIVIGTGGSVLKKIGTQARQDIERLIGGKMHLALHVKVGA